MAKTKLPLIIAHRGASGRTPEHTLEGYQLAAHLGADVIEPDLVFTKDGHLICRHDRYLSGSTNVADKPEFANRKRKDPEREGLDWYAEDFTLEEIQTLKARQTLAGRDTRFDDRFDIPTFDALLKIAKKQGWRLCPEAKQPHVAEAQGHDFKAALNPFFTAAKNGDIGPSFIQCFDPAWLKTIPKISNMERVQLLYLATGDKKDITELADHSEAIGPNKEALLAAHGGPSQLLKDAKALGLNVYPWTFRSDRLPERFASAQQEYRLFFDLGVDGLFSDHSAHALTARSAWLTTRQSKEPNTDFAVSD